MRILCPTDFSPRARAAARVGVELARRTAGSVELLHVIPLRIAQVSALGPEAAAFEAKIYSDGQARLAAECRELAVAGAQVTSWLADGDVESSILSRAAATRSELIVMAAHGRPAWERFVLGSSAERTIRRADCAVLIVPPDAELFGPRAAGPAGSRAGNQAGNQSGNDDGRAPALRVVVAFDGRATSEGALAFVSDLRRHVACDVTLLQLYWPAEEFQRLGLVGARALTTADPDIVADLERSLRARVAASGALSGPGQTAFVIEPAWGEVAERILDVASARESDLIVMGAETRRGLARIAHPPVATLVARKTSRVPVVFVPRLEPLPSISPSPSVAPAISTVLAPADFSPASKHAIAFAYGLLAARGGVVELCHVHERPLPVPAYVYDRPEGKVTDAERARIESQLRALVPPDAERLGITSHVTVIDGGTAAEAILQAAERLAVDAIVIGSHGHGGVVVRSLLGSVSQNVVRHAHRPVLVVPSPRKEAS